MSAMADMSRAIRLTVEQHADGATLAGLTDDVLMEFVQITGAFYADLRGEAERRGLVEPRS